MIILLHSSKTMRSPASSVPPQSPQLLPKATELADYIKTLSVEQLQKAMHISAPLATKTKQTFEHWGAAPAKQSLAIDSFVGDIYSGLQAAKLTTADRDYANQTLCILSGLYGILRPYDGVMPYRLEMGYKLPDTTYRNLYDFWGDTIAKTLPAKGLIVNASSVEYSQIVTDYVEPERLITPKFLTEDLKTGEPTFVVVHAKIARGAFAHWLIKQRIEAPEHFEHFNDIGYMYNEKLSTPYEPTFVCKTFGGKGLSMRLA